MNLPNGWHEVDEEEAAALEAEIARELSPGHMLAGVKLSAIARNLGCDDALFGNLTAPPDVYCVHLEAEDTFSFWKRDASLRIADAPAFVLEDFPGGLAYVASLWDVQGETSAIVLLESHH